MWLKTLHPRNKIGLEMDDGGRRPGPDRFDVDGEGEETGQNSGSRHHAPSRLRAVTAPARSARLGHHNRQPLSPRAGSDDDAELVHVASAMNLKTGWAVLQTLDDVPTWLGWKNQMKMSVWIHRNDRP